MESLRPLLITYAYNILGSLEEAKDIVQDAFERFMHADTDQVLDKKSYLVRIVINLSINRKKRKQKIVADYPGEWLPEPVATEKADRGIEQRELLSYSLMVILEKLNPRQRAVFILKEAFDYEHEQIAEVLEISPENSRKIFSRARSRLQVDGPVDEKLVPRDYLDKYIHVITKGDTERLEQLLADDIAVVSDGGGKVAAFRKPIVGRDRVIKVLLGLSKKYYSRIIMKWGMVNHQSALFHYYEGQLITCQVFSYNGHQLERIYFMRNPDKLKALQN